jgi:hypothetical protein
LWLNEKGLAFPPLSKLLFLPIRLKRRAHPIFIAFLLWSEKESWYKEVEVSPM